MKRHGKNIIALFGSDALVRLLGFAATAYMARAMDQSAFGIIGFGMAVLSYGVLVTSPGLHIIGALKIADGSIASRPLVRLISSVRLVLAAIFILCAAVAVLVHPSSALAAAAFFFSWTLIPIAVQLEWYFQGRELLTVTALGKIIAAGVFAGGVIVLLTPANVLWIVPLAYGGGIALQSLFLYAAYSRPGRDDVPAHPIGDAGGYSWRALITQSLPVGGAVIAAQALLNFPSIALGLVASPEDIAHFTAASKIVFFTLAIDRVMYALFFPFVARMHARDPQSLPLQLEQVAKYIFLFCLPVCIGGSVLAPHILTLVYGAPYAAASLVLQIQLWYFFFTILNSLFSYPLIAVGQERYYGMMTSAIAVSTIVLLMPLSVFFRAPGASAGLVVGECVLAAVMALRARSLFTGAAFAHLVKPAVASAVMGCFLAFFSYISIFILIPAGMCVYAAAAYGMKAFDMHDLRFLKERLV